MADVFISYKREERTQVAQLADALRSLNLTVWFDASLSAGEAFSDEIDREARSAKAILVCWSPTARNSRWVKAEAEIGFAQDKLAAAYVAGPDGFEAPVPFNTIHAEDLRTWLAAPEPTHTGWRSLLRRIGRLCGRPDIESWGSLDAQATAAQLRAWLGSYSESPLFPTVDAMLSAREVQDAERARVEQEIRERRERREAERREQERVEREQREREAAAQRTAQERERRMREQRLADEEANADREINDRRAAADLRRWGVRLLTVGAAAVVLMIGYNTLSASNASRDTAPPPEVSDPTTTGGENAAVEPAPFVPSRESAACARAPLSDLQATITACSPEIWSETSMNDGSRSRVYQAMGDITSAARQGGQTVPELGAIFVDRGNCPGEGCLYGFWRAKAQMPIFASPSENAAVLGTLQEGETVIAFNGEVHTPPFRGRVTRNVGRYRRGEDIYRLTYTGEGTWLYWYDGRVYSGFSGNVCPDNASDCESAFEFPEDTRAAWATGVWWAQIRRRNGETGWVVGGWENFQGASQHD